jgi:type III secretion protein C
MHTRTLILSLLFLSNVAYSINIGNNVTLNQRSSEHYNYYFNGETLREALIKFARANGMSTLFSANLSSSRLKQRVSGHFMVQNNPQLLDLLAQRYGFEWFIYSGVIYFTPVQHISLALNVAQENMESLKINLQQLGLLNPKFGYAELPAENKITISGPRLYVELLARQIKNLKISPVAQQFAVYHLKYANATDVQFSFNNQQVTIPGMATILQGLLQGRQNSSAGANYLIQQIAEPVKNQINQELNKTKTDDSSSTSNNASGLLSTPLIQADSRGNTIVIRDKATNLQIYKNLIAILDVPTPLIQVEVLIIHLDQKNLEDAGINWWGSYNGLGGGFGTANLTQGARSNSLSLSYGQVSPGQLLVGNLGNFVSNLQFLEQKNLAQMVGKPSLATTDNIPAIVNVTENLYLGANPAANTNTNLSSTQLVQSLQITPHVIFNARNQRNIKLSLLLQDGSLQENNNGLPNTTQSMITSQAVIAESQSILLAGYSRNTAVETINKVPFLGDIPLLGWFFKTKNTENHKIVTLYLVTPHIIWQDEMYKLKDFVMVGDKKISVSGDLKIGSPENYPGH